MAKNNPIGSGTIPLVPLLITESDEEFHQIRQALYEETKPVGIIEEMYVEEIVEIIWQILRLKRCKAGVTNLAFHDASAEILNRLMRAGPDVARDWISKPEVAKKVETGLATYKLDGAVIIAKAIKDSSYQLEVIAAVSQHVDVDLVAMCGNDEPLFESSPAPVTPKQTPSEPTANANAARRSLTDLLILDRYEQRAAARRDRAVLDIIARYVLMTVINRCNWRNEPNPIPSVARSVI